MPPINMYVVLVFTVSLLDSVNSRLPDGIIVPIGAIFHPGDEEAKTAFRYAQSDYNQISTNPFTIVPLFEDIDVSDSFTLASRICERMSNGLFMFFGVKDMRSLDVVQSFTRTFHMPYLSPSTASWIVPEGPSYEVHLKPDYARAIIAMILHFQWSKVHYIYDSDEGLHHIQQVLDALRMHQERGHPIVVNVVARRIYNTEHAHDELRQIDRMETDPTMLKVIIFDLSTEQAYRSILRQIPEVGMNKEGYHYLVATLDFANMDMGRYLHGGVNITGFQLLDLQSTPVKSFMKNWRRLDKHTYPNHNPDTLSYESALAVDAVKVITLALENMVNSNKKVFQSTFRRGEVFNFNKTKGIPCSTNPPLPWMHGDAIMRHIKMLDFEGLTGRIMFDHAGYREGYKLDVYTVYLDTPSHKIGSWTFMEDFVSDFDRTNNTGEIDEKSKPKIITSILVGLYSEVAVVHRFDYMYLSYIPDMAELIANKLKFAYEMRLVGDSQYGSYAICVAFIAGYIPDLAELIANKLKFSYEIRLVGDDQYGSYIEANKSWNGMIGELMTGKAQLSMAPLTIMYGREEVVDFTKPFMNFGISIMIKKPDIMKPGVFSFMEPLEMKIWICIVMAYLFVSGFLFIVSRFSPYEWQTSAGEVENKFNILNAFWFSMGALMLQGSDACPRSFSGRVIGTVWWFFVLITISSYTANLAAFLTIERMMTPIDGADDLVKQTEIKYGVLESGSSNSFFEKAKVPTYQRMWNYMSSNPSVFVKSVTDGIERVKNSKGKYAFLLESPTNEYENNKEPCDTMKVGPNLNSKGFGIATPKRSPIRDDVNLAVLQLMEEGTLLKLKTKWWKDKGVCANSESDSSGKRELSLSKVAGIFYILVGGLALAVIWASAEFLCTKTKFLDNTSYIKATDTVTTFISGTPTAERENGGVGTEHTNNSSSNNYNTQYNGGSSYNTHQEKEESTEHANNSSSNNYNTQYNGGSSYNTHQEKEEFTYNYSAPPACVGYDQYYVDKDQTEL